MTPLESIIYMIWRGFAVGVLISAPMGPVGILCIQRTLDKGRHAGFYTGVGAAISDIFYCLLTGFGLSFIEEFIERNQNVIQLVGSIVLIAFSIYLFRKDPSSPLRRPVPQNVSARKNILGGFLFTFSNPLIIFLIIGLFARFNFTSPEIKGAYYAIGYLFIIVGALAWWYGITYAIEKVRSRFNMRAMKIMNITIGVVILIFACVGIFSSITGLTSASAKAATPMRTIYLQSSDANNIHHLGKDSSMNILIDTQSCVQLDFKLRLLDRHTEILRHSRPPVTLCMTNADDNNLTLSLYVTEHSSDLISSRPTMICDASFTKGGISVCETYQLNDGLDLPGGWNHYRLSYSPQTGLTLKAGNKSLQNLVKIVPDKFPELLSLSNITISAPADGAVELRDVRLQLPQKPLKASLTLEEAMEHIRYSHNPTEGLWEIFDWSIDTKTTRRGGDYRLAIVHVPDGWYDMLYVDGAETMPRQWEPGMVKGRLIPTDTPYLYNLIWVDAEGGVMERGLRSQVLPLQKTMTLHFPYLDAILRLNKIK